MYFYIFAHDWCGKRVKETHFPHINKENDKDKRDITEKMFQWKNSALHKPLLIKGARQIGKTWLMRKFGKEHFKLADRTEKIIGIYNATALHS